MRARPPTAGRSTQHRPAGNGADNSTRRITGGADYRAGMTTTDPLVTALARMVVDVVRFFDTCDDEEVDLDTAVKMMEALTGELAALPSDQLARFVRAVAALAEAEPDPAHREFLRMFPPSCGLTERVP